MVIDDYTRLINGNFLQEQVKRVAILIGEAYKDQPITLVPIMNGALPFANDVLRHLHHETDTRVCAVKAEAYGTGTTSNGVTVYDGLLREEDIRDRNILLLDDIWDTGGTLREVTRRIEHLKPKYITAAVLLRKQLRHTGENPDVSYVVFDIPDLWVYGYGLDDEGKCRQFSDIRVKIEEHVRSEIETYRSLVKIVGQLQPPPHQRK